MIEKRGKHSWVCLKAYRLFLLGDEDALGNLDINKSDFQKMKTFHEKIEGGQSAYIIGRALRFPEFVSRSMGLMYQDWIEDKPIRDLYPSSENRPRVARAYELVLAGTSECNLRALGFSEYAIEKAILYRQFENADMLPATVSQKIGLPISTVKNLQKIQRDNKQQTDMREEIRASVIA